MEKQIKNILIKAGKVILWIAGGVISLLIVVVILLNIPAIQNMILDKVENSLSSQTGTRISVKNARILLPTVYLHGFYVEGHENDTLLWVGELKVTAGILPLLKREISIDNLRISDVTANVAREKKTGHYNFQFIIDSLASDQKPQRTGKPWDFMIGRVVLENVRVNYDDRYTGQTADINLGNFTVNMKTLDTRNMKFKAGNISLAGSTILYNRLKIENDPVNGPAGPEKNANNDRSGNQPGDGPVFSVDEITLSDNSIQYGDQVSGTSLQIRIGEFLIREGELNMEEQHGDVSVVKLTGSRLEYEKRQAKGSSGPVDSGSDGSNATGNEGKDASGNSSSGYSGTSAKNEQLGDATEPSASWRFHLGNLDLENNTLAYQDRRYPVEKGHFDANHLDIDLLNATIEDIKYDSSFQGDIHSLEAREKNGLSIQDLQGAVYYSQEEINVKNFLLKTAASSLQAEKINVTDYLNLDSMDVEAGLNGTLDAAEIGYLIPAANQYISGLKAVNLDAELEKKDHWIRIENIRLSTDGLMLTMQGGITDFQNPEQVNLDEVSLKLEATASTLRSVLPPNILPDSLNLPSNISLALGVNGSADDFSGNVELNSSLGGVEANVAKGSLNTGEFSTKGRIKLNSIQAGRIMNNPDLGLVDADFSLSGKGSDLLTSDIELKGKISRLGYSDYEYKDIHLNVDYQNPDLWLKISEDQPEIAFTLDGHAVVRDSFPSAEIHLNLEKIDFDSLNLWNNEMIARADISADLDSIQTGKLNGSVSIRNVAFIKNNEVIKVDSMLVASIDQEDNSELSIDSDLLSFKLKGNIPIMKIPSVTTGMIQRIMSAESDTLNAYSDYHMNFNLELFRNELLSELFVPGLKRLDIRQFTGELDGSENLVKLDIDMPVIEYGPITAKALTIHSDSEKEGLEGSINIGKLTLGGYTVSGIHVNTMSSNDRILVNLGIPKYDSAFLKVVTEITTQSGVTALHIMEDSLVLNGKHWDANPENRLVLGATLKAENFSLSRQNQEIRISGEPSGGADQATRISIENFSLSALGNIFDSEKPILNGSLNADVALKKGNQFPEGEITIDSLAYKANMLGNINASFDNVPSGLNLDFQLAGDSGKLDLHGLYMPEKENGLDMVAEFQHFSLQALRPLTDTLVNTLEGDLDGRLSVSGTTSVPSIEGELDLLNVRVFPVMMNTWIYLQDETIFFEKDDIRFRDFTLQDAEKREARLNGTVRTNNFKSVDLDLSFETDEFLAFNSEESKNDNLFYGKILVGTDVDLKGSPAKLEISGNVALKENSELNIVIPGTGGNVIQRDKIVNFIDLDRKTANDRFQLAIRQEKADSTVQGVEGMDISLNIAIEENSRMKFIIDEQTGENLAIQGKGNLSFRLEPNGNVNLTGRYDINDGQYFLNFQGLVKREFDILDGSYIEWTGQPTSANLNIDANYSLETSAPVTDAKDRIPVNVVIHIGGEIMSPELSFSISMPEETRQQYQQVAAYINDVNNTESELNKQVMSLVLFKSFMTDEMGGSGVGLSSTARSSISKFLTQQLNRLSSGIEGFDVTFDLQSYENQSGNEGPRGVTNLQVGLSQSLFSDRLTVKVSGDVYLEGAEQYSNDVLNYVDDVALEYDLTENGNFQLVGFRENEYDAISQGQIIKSGVGIIFSKDYDKISDLFKDVSVKENSNSK